MPSAINIGAVTGVPAATDVVAGKVRLGTGLSNTVAGALLSSATNVEITETSHTHTVGQIVTHNGTAFVAAMADSAVNAEVVGVVSAVTTDTFTIATAGQVDGLTGLTAGTVYFLSDSVAGTHSATEPVVSGTVSKPVYLALTSTSALILPHRGYIV